MTYKEIINRFRQVTSDHFMLQDFGYGELSDIKTQSQLGPEEQGADYPYLFLNPTSHTRTGPVMNYSFNMIVMDMARGEEGDVYDNYITIQSQCQQYIDDVLSQLYYAYQDKPEIQLTGITYTPFKEKYQDTLAGMTATVTIQVPVPIDNCIAPYFRDELLYSYTLPNPITKDYNSGSYGTRGIIPLWNIPEAPSFYRIEYNLEFQVLTPITEDTPTINIFQDADNPRYLDETVFDGLNTTTTQTITTSIRVELQDVPPDNNDLGIEFGQFVTPFFEDSINLLSATVKIYKTE